MLTPLPALTLACCATLLGCGTHTSTLAFAETKALCDGLLPQVTGELACRMDELAADTRLGAEPRYDAETTASFRTNGHLDHFTALKVSGPAADPLRGPSDCVANAVRRLSVPERSDTLTMPLRLQYMETEAVNPTASVQPGGRCTLTIPVRAP